MHPAFVTFLFLIALPACTIFQTLEANWPANVPPRGYFVDVYRQDALNADIQTQDQYLTWVTRFYQGWVLYPRGWNSVTEELLARIEDEDTYGEVKDKMASLGLVICGEWAKNNKTRLINTRHVSIWGHALHKSLENNEILALFERVNTDIEDLLSGKIAANQIAEDRYYSQEDIYQDIEHAAGQ